MLLQFAVVEAEIIQFYQDVIQPRLTILGESADQVWVDLSSRLDNIERKIQDFSNRAATEWAGKEISTASCIYIRTLYALLGYVFATTYHV